MYDRIFDLFKETNLKKKKSQVKFGFFVYDKHHFTFWWKTDLSLVN